MVADLYKEVQKGHCSSRVQPQTNPWALKMKAARLMIDAVIAEPAPCFLLPAIFDFLERIATDIPMTFAEVEFYLVHLAGLSKEEELLVRGKIAGRFIPRADYQQIFPVGSATVFEGPHYVTSHFPIDLDTKVASFWGWLDAFACKVGSTLHRWNLPRTGDEEIVEKLFLFDQPFTSSMIERIALSDPILTPSALDLASCKGLQLRQKEESLFPLDGAPVQHAVVVIDEKGFFLGDWKASDVEEVSYLTSLLTQCLVFIENHLTNALIHLFAEKGLTKALLEQKLQEIEQLELISIAPFKAYSGKMKERVMALFAILTHQNGIKTMTWERFSSSVRCYDEYRRLTECLVSALPWDHDGKICENQAVVLELLRQLINGLGRGTEALCIKMATFEMALEIKHHVLNRPSRPIGMHTSVEQILQIIGSDPYITVTYQIDGQSIPIGVIYAEELHRKMIGTVSLRDFSNREEVQIPSYLETISIIDHHRSEIHTQSPAVVSIGDFQSCNVRMAENSFIFADRYSTGGMNYEEIEAQLQNITPSVMKGEKLRIFHKLALRKAALHKKPYFVESQRELLEYFAYLLAIFDDTDLLTKVTQMDVECIRALLSRMRSLLTGEVVEVVNFDHLARDALFVKQAARLLLKSEECYSLYSKVWSEKEKVFEKHLYRALEGDAAACFRDTKQQGGVALVGQMKYYPKNVPLLLQHHDALMRVWVGEAEKAHHRSPHLLFHLMMLSTMPDAKGLYDGSQNVFHHRDQLWIWVPQSDIALSKLALFLRAFEKGKASMVSDMKIECRGEHAAIYGEVVKEWCSLVPVEISTGGLSLIVIDHPAATLVSRKKDIAPYVSVL